MTSSSPPSAPQFGARSPAMRLEDVLRQLPERELTSLIHRSRIRIDEAKRIEYTLSGGTRAPHAARNT